MAMQNFTKMPDAQQSAHDDRVKAEQGGSPEYALVKEEMDRYLGIGRPDDRVQFGTYDSRTNGNRCRNDGPITSYLGNKIR